MQKWIKVDTDHMPKNMESVMVTAEWDDGRKYVLPECRWNAEYNWWEWPCEAGAGYWEEQKEKVTHWMSYPEPAQDD